MVLGAAYMLWLYRRVVFGEIVHDDVKTMHEMTAREMTFFIPIVLMVVWIGIYPKPYFSAMDASGWRSCSSRRPWPREANHEKLRG